MFFAWSFSFFLDSWRSQCSVCICVYLNCIVTHVNYIKMLTDWWYRVSIMWSWYLCTKNGRTTKQVTILVIMVKKHHDGGLEWAWHHVKPCYKHLVHMYNWPCFVWLRSWCLFLRGKGDRRNWSVYNKARKKYLISLDQPQGLIFGNPGESSSHRLSVCVCLREWGRWVWHNKEKVWVKR